MNKTAPLPVGYLEMEANGVISFVALDGTRYPSSFACVAFQNTPEKLQAAVDELKGNIIYLVEVRGDEE